MIAKSIQKVLDKKNLERIECAEVIAAIVDGAATPAQAGAFLAALRAKGEAAAEIAGAASVLRQRATHISVRAPVFVDTCGTGGDRKNTFNISTAAAIVVAACGVVVAKHGNRAVSSNCGSADVLSELGVRIDLGPAEVEACIERAGIGFLLAPRLHPSLGNVAPIRRELGVRTIFNLVGPLVSPALPRRQVIGVFDPKIAREVARAVAMLGAERTLVVHGDGLDEISISGPTAVYEIRGDRVTKRVLQPRDFGVPVSSADALAGGDAACNADLVRRIFAGEKSPRRDAVIAASAATLYVAGIAIPTEAARVAADAIDSGAAAAKLDALVCATREEAA